MQFHETVRGKVFFEYQLPELIKAINRLADATEKQEHQEPLCQENSLSKRGLPDSVQQAPNSMEAIVKEYGETILSIALAHFMHIGKDKLENEDIEAVCKKARENYNEKSLFTPEVEDKILRCAHDIAFLEINDILEFIKIGYSMPGVFVQEGKVIRFLHNATGEHILDVVVPSETPNEIIDAAQENLENLVEKYEKEHNGDFCEFDASASIYEALRKAGAQPHDLQIFREIYA